VTSEASFFVVIRAVSSVFDENVADARSGKERRARGGGARSFGVPSAAATGPAATRNAPGIAPEDAARRWEGRDSRGVRSERSESVFVPTALVEDDSARGTAGGRRREGARAATETETSSALVGRSPRAPRAPATPATVSATLVADAERERL
jgi:hypothetical protein